MKKILMIPALVLVMCVAAVAKNPHENSVKVVSARLDVVYFKVSCDMIGASMEVYDSNGTMLLSQKVTDRKILVDFYAEPSGSYTIHLKKDGTDEVIIYNKETASHAERASANYLMVTQE